MRKRKFFQCLCMLLCFCAMLGCFTACTAQSQAVKMQTATPTPTPTATSTESIWDTFAQPAAPKAERQAKEWLQISVPEANTALTLATLQGLTVDVSDRHIVLSIGGAFPYLTKSVKENYNVTVTTTDGQGEVWTTWSLLSLYKEHLSGYILCDSVTEGESASVAVSLSQKENRHLLRFLWHIS